MIRSLWKKNVEKNIRRDITESGINSSYYYYYICDVCDVCDVEVLYVWCWNK